MRGLLDAVAASCECEAMKRVERFMVQESQRVSVLFERQHRFNTTSQRHYDNLTAIKIFSQIIQMMLLRYVTISLWYLYYFELSERPDNLFVQCVGQCARNCRWETASLCRLGVQSLYLELSFAIRATWSSCTRRYRRPASACNAVRCQCACL